MLYRQTTSRYWWSQFKHQGRRYRISTGETDRRRAEAQARRLRVEIEAKAGPPGRQKQITVEHLAALDIARVRASGLGAGREKTITEIWRPLSRILGADTDATTLTLGDVQAYEGERRQEEARGQTIRRELAALKRALLLSERHGMIRTQPIDWRHAPKVRTDPPLETQRSKPWTAEDIAKVLRCLSVKAVTAGIRDQLRLIQITGLRLHEAQRLRASWVVGKALRVPAEGAKTRTTRAIPLSPEAKKIIRRHAKAAAGEPLFPNKPNHAIKLACVAAKVRHRLTPRDLRAWYLTQAARVDLRAAQALAGHTSIATTSRYLHVDDERIQLAAAGAAKAAGGAIPEGPYLRGWRRKVR